MMLKLHVLNLKSFLQMLQTCSGPVELTLPDGSVQTYHAVPAVEKTLAQNFAASRKWLPLTIRVHAPQDYFAVVSYAAGL